ncbi:MAG: hypothetical protein IBX62_01705 [Coriobacteriia bacterium]|nr:hypothetical protein [Coriobacteriia bacterium]
MHSALTPADAGFVLALAGTIALLFAEPLARLDARLPFPFSHMTDERRSRRMVEVSSAGCLALGALLLAAARVLG